MNRASGLTNMEQQVARMSGATCGMQETRMFAALIRATLATSNEREVMADHEGWPIRELWEKYEDIAMHFNDLIIRLRTQALAGVAALSTLVGIFAKADLGQFTYTWEIAGFVFLALTLFWIAIWILDFWYYNDLLVGAVAALLELEKESETKSHISHINMSTLVERSVAGELNFKLGLRKTFRVVAPRWTFYILVFLALLAGAGFSFWMHFHSASPPVPVAFWG